VVVPSREPLTHPPVTTTTATTTDNGRNDMDESQAQAQTQAHARGWARQWARCCDLVWDAGVALQAEAPVGSPPADISRVKQLRFPGDPAKEAEAVTMLIATSTAPYIIKIRLPCGATVRDAVEIDEGQVTGTLLHDTIVEAFEKGVTHDGVVRYRISERDWISDKLRGSSSDQVITLLKELLDPPRPYKVVRKGGAKVPH
jgi:hypothetical protein